MTDTVEDGVMKVYTQPDDSGSSRDGVVTRLQAMLQLHNQKILQLEADNRNLQKLVPKERLRVKLHRTPITELYYAVDMVGLARRMSPMFEDESGCIQWCEDHGFEVVE